MRILFLFVKTLVVCRAQKLWCSQAVTSWQKSLWQLGCSGCGRGHSQGHCWQGREDGLRWLWWSLLHQQEPEQEGLEAERGEEEEEEEEWIIGMFQHNSTVGLTLSREAVRYIPCMQLWGVTIFEGHFLKLASIIFIWDLFIVQINWIKHNVEKKAFRNTYFSLELTNKTGILIVFVSNSSSFQFLSITVSLQESIVLTFVSFFQCLLTKHSFFSPWNMSWNRMKDFTSSTWIFELFSYYFTCDFMGTKDRQFPKADTSEPFKRAFSNHMQCNQIFKLFTSMRNRRPFHCINCINFGAWEVQLIENKDLYLFSKEKTQTIFVYNERQTS